MIRSNPFAVLMVSALFLSALASCWFSAWWFLGTRELQGLEYHSQAMTRVSNAMQALAGDAVEYSRRNPGIDPVLQKFDIKVKPGAAGATAPAGAAPTSR